LLSIKVKNVGVVKLTFFLGSADAKVIPYLPTGPFSKLNPVKVALPNLSVNAEFLFVTS